MDWNFSLRLRAQQSNFIPLGTLPFKLIFFASIFGFADNILVCVFGLLEIGNHLFHLDWWRWGLPDFLYISFRNGSVIDAMIQFIVDLQMHLVRLDHVKCFQLNPLLCVGRLVRLWKLLDFILSSRIVSCIFCSKEEDIYFVASLKLIFFLIEEKIFFVLNN